MSLKRNILANYASQIDVTVITGGSWELDRIN